MRILGYRVEKKKKSLDLQNVHKKNVRAQLRWIIYFLFDKMCINCDGKMFTEEIPRCLLKTSCDFASANQKNKSDVVAMRFCFLWELERGGLA